MINLHPADLLVLLCIVAVMNVVISIMVCAFFEAYMQRRADNELHDTQFTYEKTIIYQDGKTNRDAD